MCDFHGYSTYTERRSASETAIEFALLSFYLLWAESPKHKASTFNCCVQSIKCECSKLDIDNNFFLGEISQTVSYWKWISDCRQLVPFMQRIIATIFSCFFRNWIRYCVCYQLYNSQSTEYNSLSVRTLENSDLLLCLRHCLFLTCSNRDRPIFSRNIPSETCSEHN